MVLYKDLVLPISYHLALHIFGSGCPSRAGVFPSEFGVGLAHIFLCVHPSSLYVHMFVRLLCLEAKALCQAAASSRRCVAPHGAFSQAQERHAHLLEMLQRRLGKRTNFIDMTTGLFERPSFRFHVSFLECRGSQHLQNFSPSSIFYSKRSNVYLS